MKNGKHEHPYREASVVGQRCRTLGAIVVTVVLFGASISAGILCTTARGTNDDNGTQSITRTPADPRDAWIDGWAKATPLSAVVPVRIPEPTPAPQPTVQAAPRPVFRPNDRWRALVTRYFGAANADAGLRVIWGPSGICPTGESGGDPSAFNANQVGLFQVYYNVHAWRVNYNIQALYDPETNVRVASEIFFDAGGSWKPWSCRP